MKQYYQANKEDILQYQKQHEYIKRGLGFKPINNYFHYSTAHHLHLENSKDLIIYIPFWEHEIHRHKIKTWEGMDTINSIALDYWVNESLYTELLKP